MLLKEKCIHTNGDALGHVRARLRPDDTQYFQINMFNADVLVISLGISKKLS